MGRGDRDRDYVADAAAELIRYLDVLEVLMCEPPSPQGGPAGVTSRSETVPEPYRQAGAALMTAHEGLRRLEAAMRLILLGHPGPRRGGSAGNTREAARMIVKFSSQLGDDGYAQAALILDRWVNGARAVPGIDELKRWRHIGRAAACPYCGCWQLLADMDAGVVVCSLPGCKDKAGWPPVASMGTDDAGRPQLAWNDGLRTQGPDLDGVAA